MSQRFLFAAIGVLAALLLIAVTLLLLVCDDDWCFVTSWQRARATNSFQECADRGFAVMESYPRRCALPDGRSFTEEIAVTFPPQTSSSSGAEANIVVTSPVAGATITSPVVITGRARVFENAFSYRVRDADGTLLAEGNGTADAPDIGLFGPFTVSLSYPPASGTTGTVEVFDYSAKDGTPIDVVTIPVSF